MMPPARSARHRTLNDPIPRLSCGQSNGYRAQDIAPSPQGCTGGVGEVRRGPQAPCALFERRMVRIEHERLAAARIATRGPIAGADHLEGVRFQIVRSARARLETDWRDKPKRSRNTTSNGIDRAPGRDPRPGAGVG